MQCNEIKRKAPKCQATAPACLECNHKLRRAMRPAHCLSQTCPFVAPKAGLDFGHGTLSVRTPDDPAAVGSSGARPRGPRFGLHQGPRVNTITMSRPPRRPSAVRKPLMGTRYLSRLAGPGLVSLLLLGCGRTPAPSPQTAGEKPKVEADLAYTTLSKVDAAALRIESSEALSRPAQEHLQLT